MKRVCAIVLICVLTVSLWPVRTTAQTGPHFVTTVLSQSGIQGGLGRNGTGDATILRHSTTNGGYAIIGTHDNSYDDGYNFVEDVWSYVNVFDSNWIYGWQDTMYVEIGGYYQDNGNGTTTIWIWYTYQIDDSGPIYSGAYAYYELNSTLAAGQSASLQAVMTHLDGCNCGNTSQARPETKPSILARLWNWFAPTVHAWTVNWKCAWLAATDPICDEMEVIFPGAWLPCALVVYELCTQVENLGPGGKGHALNRTPL